MAARHGYAISLARMYAQSHLGPGRAMLIVPAAEAGVSSERWLADLYDDMADRVRIALAQPGDNRVVWYSEQQGEADTFLIEARKSGASVATFHANKTELIRRLRGDFGDMAIMLGNFVPIWIAKRKNRREMVAAIRDVCAKTERCAFVPSKGLEANPEELAHFNARSQEMLAKRHYNAFLSC
jgi:hypothetical protein